MANNNTSIKINGQRYETPATAISQRPAMRSIDGVVASRANHVPSQTKPMSSARAHKPAPNVAGHIIKPSATLMRHAVQKPASASLKRTTKVHSSTLALTPKPQHSIQTKLSVKQVKPERLIRASQVATSARVSRFSRAPALPKISLPAAKSSYQPVITPLVSQSTTTSDIFERALARATSHEQPAPDVSSKQRRVSKLLRRRTAYIGGAALVMIVAGFLSLQAMSSIKFKMASNRAGFSATMPGYKPTGFSLASLESSAGFLGLTFNGSNNAFAITEKPSNWNSQTLLANVISGDSSYNTVEAAGRTIYLYGKNQAAWVNNGILYQLSAHNSLNTQQMADLAASM